MTGRIIKTGLIYLISGLISLVPSYATPNNLTQQETPAKKTNYVLESLGFGAGFLGGFFAHELGHWGAAKILPDVNIRFKTESLRDIINGSWYFTTPPDASRPSAEKRAAIYSAGLVADYSLAEFALTNNNLPKGLKYGLVIGPTLRTLIRGTGGDVKGLAEALGVSEELLFGSLMVWGVTQIYRLTKH